MANLINDNHLNRMRMIIERERQLKSKVNSKMSNDEFDIYDDSHQQYKSSYTSKFPDPDLKISVLTSENQKLKTLNSDLIKKTNLLIDAYRKLETEHKKLKIKRNRKESIDKTLSGLWEGVNNLTKKIIIWFNT